MNIAIKNIEERVVPNLENKTKKDLVMTIITLQHLDNSNSFSLGTDVLISSISTLSACLIDLKASKVIFAAFAATFATKLVIDVFEHYKIAKLKDKLVTELITRYDTPQMAYLEISQLILSTTREEIINYLNDLGCEYNAE